MPAGGGGGGVLGAQILPGYADESNGTLRLYTYFFLIHSISKTKTHSRSSDRSCNKSNSVLKSNLSSHIGEHLLSSLDILGISCIYACKLRFHNRILYLFLRRSDFDSDTPPLRLLKRLNFFENELAH